jgi:hypothetical protein
MYISTAAPNKRSLGATNGIAQTMVAIQRTIGPAAAASLFAFSLENNILGGNFVYVVMLATVWLGWHRCTASEEHVETPFQSSITRTVRWCQKEVYGSLQCLGLGLLVP